MTVGALPLAVVTGLALGVVIWLHTRDVLARTGTGAVEYLPTFLAAAAVSPHPDYPLDGVDLLKHEGPRDLFWRMKYRDQKAMRSGQWKYLAIEGNEFLFDLSRDSRERANYAKRNPGKFGELQERYRQWEASLPPVPEDAKVSLVYGPADMAQPS